jgi:hypothetical protein
MFLLSLKEQPNGFIISYPEYLELDTNSSDGEYVLISNEYVKAKTLEVNIRVPLDAEPGEYKVLLKASSQNEQTNSLGVNMDKIFLLKVNVIGEYSEPIKTENESKLDNEIENIVKIENETINIGRGIEKDASSISGMLIISNEMFFWAMLAILTFFISYLIYKKIRNLYFKKEVTL